MDTTKILNAKDEEYEESEMERDTMKRTIDRRRHASRKCKCYIPKRYVVTFLTGMGMLVTYCMRTNIGVAAITILDLQAHTKVTDRAKWSVSIAIHHTL